MFNQGSLGLVAYLLINVPLLSPLHIQRKIYVVKSFANYVTNL